MTRARLAAPLLVVILLALAHPAPAGSDPETPPTPVSQAASPKDVTTLNEDVGTALAGKNDESFAQALAHMETLRHESFVPHIRTGLKSVEPNVLAAAIRAAATHELKDVEKDIRKLLHPKSRKEVAALHGGVAAAAVDYLVRMSVAGEEGTVLDDLLLPLLLDQKRMKASSGIEIARASIHYLGKNKYRRAVSHLGAMIPQPKPKNVDDPKNPPAAFWEARVKIWQSADGWVRWALKEITGQEFAGDAEWAAWLKQNAKDYR